MKKFGDWVLRFSISLHFFLMLYFCFLSGVLFHVGDCLDVARLRP